jgi:ribonuclease D
VKFLDTVGEEFDAAVSHLLASKLVGVDTEFNPRWTKFSE